MHFHIVLSETPRGVNTIALCRSRLDAAMVAEEYQRRHAVAIEAIHILEAEVTLELKR